MAKKKKDNTISKTVIFLNNIADKVDSFFKHHRWLSLFISILLGLVTLTNLFFIFPVYQAVTITEPQIMEFMPAYVYEYVETEPVTWSTGTTPNIPLVREDLYFILKIKNMDENPIILNSFEIKGKTFLSLEEYSQFWHQSRDNGGTVFDLNKILDDVSKKPYFQINWKGTFVDDGLEMDNIALKSNEEKIIKIKILSKNALTVPISDYLGFIDGNPPVKTRYFIRNVNEFFITKNMDEKGDYRNYYPVEYKPEVFDGNMSFFINYNNTQLEIPPQKIDYFFKLTKNQFDKVSSEYWLNSLYESQKED